MSLPDAPPRDRPGPAWFSQVRVIDLVLWYLASAVVVFVVPSVARLGGAPWSVPPGDEIQAWYWTLAFVIGASSLTLLRALRGGLSLAWTGLVVASPFVVAFLALNLRSGIAHSRVQALMASALGALLLVVPALTPSTAKHIIARTILSAAAVGGVLFGTRTVSPQTTAAPVDRTANTALLPVVIHYESKLVPVAGVSGGAIARLGSSLLLATGAGSWYELGWDSSGTKMRARQLSLPAPMARDGLADAAYPVPLLRVTDVAVDTTLDTATVYVAHEVWNREQRCLALRVSAIRIHAFTAAETGWRPIYETQPCIDNSQEGFDPFESGGRLLILPDGALLLTVGDYGLNHDSASAMAQKPDVDYGKTIRIDPDGKRTLYTMGHRNPSGLASDEDGNLWVAEHGPRGGDEINLLSAGANYGWPLITYGTDYGSFHWRFTAPSGSERRFTEPAFVLMPSVAFSSLISIQGRLFEQWSGDLLAGSLSGGKLVRIRRAGTRVVYTEPIEINRRIRDVVEAPAGQIVLWTDVGDLIWLSPSPDLLAGAVAYEACARCHGPIEEGDSRPTGPGLAGIDGRAVASNPGFAYSEALKRLGGRWTDERLDAFLKAPAEFAPGTTMLFPGIADTTQRRALVKWLQRGGG